jgi:hypothetical protein
MDERNSLYEVPDDLPPVVRSCYEIAAQGHDNARDERKRFRKKQESVSLPYITHPVAAANILLALGKQDQFLIGAAYLHDALEDFAPSKAALEISIDNCIRENLHAEDDFSDQKKQSIASASARVISDIVQEVSNPENELETKRVEQVDRADTLSSRAKKIKMADLAASLADDLIYAPAVSEEQRQRFIRRAKDVIKVCSDADEKLARLGYFLADWNRAVIEGNAQNMFPASFDLREAIERSNNYQPFRIPQKAQHWLDHPESNGDVRGIIHIGLDDNGKVCRFRMLANPNGGKEDRANQDLFTFIDRLEADTQNYATIAEPSLDNSGNLNREILLNTPVPLEQFRELAQGQKVLDNRFGQVVKREISLKQNIQTQR